MGVLPSKSSLSRVGGAAAGVTFRSATVALGQAPARTQGQAEGRASASRTLSLIPMRMKRMKRTSRTSRRRTTPAGASRARTATARGAIATRNPGGRASRRSEIARPSVPVRRNVYDWGSRRGPTSRSTSAARGGGRRGRAKKRKAIGRTMTSRTMKTTRSSSQASASPDRGGSPNCSSAPRKRRNPFVVYASPTPSSRLALYATHFSLHSVPPPPVSPPPPPPRPILLPPRPQRQLAAPLRA